MLLERGVDDPRIEGLGFNKGEVGAFSMAGVVETLAGEIVAVEGAEVGRFGGGRGLGVRPTELREVGR